MLGSMGRHALRGLVALALMGSVGALGAAAPARAVTPVESGRQPAAPASEIVPGAAHRGSIRMTATYAVTARLSLRDRELAGRVTITARNDSGAGVDRVRLNTVMGPLGRLSLREVTVDGAAVTPSIADQTVTVPLGGTLPAGASAVIVLRFRATLRSTTSGSTWLFTRANGVTSMYRWVPWISRTNGFDRPNIGDPFVTPASPAATLRLRTDQRAKVVANGTRTSISDDGLVTTWAFSNVRDIVVNAAADYRTAKRDVGDTQIRVHTRPGQPAAAMLDATENAVRKLEQRLGPYPWRILRIVQSSGGVGMEGPGIVWIPAGVAPSNLRYLLMHEVAHQWFYGIVGNDQAREPFADEAITDMVARYLTDTRRGSRCTRGTLDGSIYDYSGSCYYERVYIQGGNLLDRARQRLGTKTFFATLRRYLADNRWSLVHTRTLLDALDDATPVDLGARWKPRFPALY